MLGKLFSGFQMLFQRRFTPRNKLGVFEGVCVCA